MTTKIFLDVSIDTSIDTRKLLKLSRLFKPSNLKKSVFRLVKYTEELK